MHVWKFILLTFTYMPVAAAVVGNFHGFVFLVLFYRIINGINNLLQTWAVLVHGPNFTIQLAKHTRVDP
jgi:hypothetical protein